MFKLTQGFFIQLHSCEQCSTNIEDGELVRGEEYKEE